MNSLNFSIHSKMEEKDTKKSATQGKGKNKNKKINSMSLNDFVKTGPTQAGYTAVPAMRWAEVMDGEDEDLNNYVGKNQDPVLLPIAPKSFRGPDIDINQVPTQPPFMCYLSNLPFEASEDDINKFFKDLKITRIDLSRDPSMSGRARGQGTCEFPDRQTLIDAFTYNNEPIKNRPIKLSLHLYEERENYRRERDNDKEDRTAGDWRSGKPADKPMGNFQQSNRQYSDSNHFGNRNRNYENRYENRNNYERNDSYGGDNMNRNNYNNYNNYNNRQSNRVDRNFNNGNNYQNNSGDMNSNRYPPNDSQRNDEPPKERPRLVLDKRTIPKPEFPQPPINMQHQSHHLDHLSSSNSPPQGLSESESSKSIEPEKPVERKKLILLPKKSEVSSDQPIKTNPSIFGEAKPVDTTKRLLEIEIKKQQELQEAEKLLEDKQLEKELVEKFEKPARDFNNPRSNNREYNKQRLSDSNSNQGDSRPAYREGRNDYSQDNNNRNNRFNESGSGYRKPGGRKINQTGNRNYNNDNYPNNNRDYNRENNRDNYSSSRDNQQRDLNQRSNKFNNNRNNNWSNDQVENKRENQEQSYDERSNYRQGGNRRDRGNEGFNQTNKFTYLTEGEMD